MKYKCLNCGKTVYNAEEERSYCDECRDQMVKLILKQDAAARREIDLLKKRLKVVTDGRISIGSTAVDDVQVHSGMAELARLLGEEIKVVEMEDGVSWVFQFTHDGVRFHRWGFAYNRDDAAIVEAWREKHGTFC